MALRSSIRRHLIAWIDRLLPPPHPTGRQLFERRYLVGSIAIDSGWQLAESARRLLALEAEVGDCYQMVAATRRCFGGSLPSRRLELPNCTRHNPYPSKATSG
jgi:hypothetical protein